MDPTGADSGAKFWELEGQNVPKHLRCEVCDRKLLKGMIALVGRIGPGKSSIVWYVCPRCAEAGLEGCARSLRTLRARLGQWIADNHGLLTAFELMEEGGG